jgi:hypothetical protein
VACEGLGIQTSSKGFGFLGHCAGNDAAFTLEMFLALGTLDASQHETFCGGERIRPMLPTSFVDFTLARVNNPKILLPPLPPANGQTADADECSSLVSPIPGASSGQLQLTLPPVRSEGEYDWVPSAWKTPKACEIRVSLAEILESPKLYSAALSERDVGK